MSEEPDFIAQNGDPMTEGERDFWLKERLYGRMRRMAEPPVSAGELVGKLQAAAEKLAAIHESRDRDDTRITVDEEVIFNACCDLDEAASAITAANADRDRLAARLEIDHFFKMEGGVLMREEIPRDEQADFPDGITARDCTIQLLTEDRDRLARELEEATKFVEAADRVIAKQRRELEEAREALREARSAINSLDKWALGEGGTGDPDNPSQIWPLRDELLHNIDRSLTPTGGGE